MKLYPFDAIFLSNAPPPPLPIKPVLVKGVFSGYMGLSPPRVCEIYGFRRVLGPKGTTRHPPERKQTLSPPPHGQNPDYAPGRHPW